MHANAGTGDSVLRRYFTLLDARRIDELLAMFDPSGGMITRGGTEGVLVSGLDGLRGFYESRGPATAVHHVVHEASDEGVAFAEGLVWPNDGGAPKFFIASASMSPAGQILRYTTLVWADLSDDQRFGLLPDAPMDETPAS